MHALSIELQWGMNHAFSVGFAQSLQKQKTGHAIEK